MTSIRLLTFAFSTAFCLLGTNLFKMQVIDYPKFLQASERNRVRPVILEAPRGQIVDRHGQELAASRISFDAYIVPPAKKEEEAVLSAYGKSLGISHEEITRRFNKNKGGRYTPVLIAEDLEKDDAIRIEEETADLPGVFIKTRPIRTYPLGPAAAHVIGYIGAIGPEEFDRRKVFEYLKTDWVGRNGLESSYEGYLRGEHGVSQFESDSRGRLLKVLSIRERVQGRTLATTLDRDLQLLAYEALGDRTGAVAVMDLKDGGLWAMASTPSYDPNWFVAPSVNASQIRHSLSDRKKPLLNRAISDAYPPGSTFKIISAAAALRANKVDSGTRYFCPGVYVISGFSFRCWKAEGHGSQSLIEALEHSCNVFFYNLGIKIGVEALAKESRRAGLGRPTGIDLPYEVAGLVPDPEWKRKTRREKWYTGETANLVIGQGSLTTTPLQMLRATAVTATKGKVFEPYLVHKIDDVDISPKHPSSVRLSDSQWRVIHQGMERVVGSVSGTGQRAKHKDVQIAGKTGTAQAPKNAEDHAWFVGYAPADNPKAAIVVFVEHGGKGGAAGAGIAGQMFAHMQENGYFDE